LTGLTSTPSDGAVDWMATNWPIPAVMGGIPYDCRSRHARCDLFEQVQPFSTYAEFERGETGGVAVAPAAPGR
jgi:hypothetical protein